MTKQEGIKLIQQRIKEIKNLEELYNEHPKFKDWLEQTIAIIKNIENLPPKYLKDFANLPFRVTRLNPGCNPPPDVHDISRYKEDLHIAKTILKGVIDRLKLHKA